MKTKIKLRLILSVLMLCMTAVTLTTSTFAWFATNRNAWFDEIELEIGNTDNILISVDGNSFRSSIPADMVKRAVVAKKKTIDYNDNSLNDEDYINNEWKKISLEPITTNDLDNYLCIDNDHIESINDHKYYQLHEVDETNTYSYLEFDLWFMMESSKSATKTYDLRLVDDEYIAEERAQGHEVKSSYIKGNESEIELYNDLKTITKGYKAGEKLIVNTQNAMRVGIKRLEQKGANDIKNYIFEPYEGLGSYALNDYLNTQDENYYKYDPSKNAMFTYFNKINEITLRSLTQENFDYVNGVYKNELKDDVSLGEIIPLQNGTGYTKIKLTVSVWLEGFDADYIVGMRNNSLKMYLNFYAKEKNSND